MVFRATEPISDPYIHRVLLFPLINSQCVWQMFHLRWGGGGGGGYGDGEEACCSSMVYTGSMLKYIGDHYDMYSVRSLGVVDASYCKIIIIYVIVCIMYVYMYISCTYRYT